MRLDRRVKLLVDALIDELDCSRSFLLHVGPRATRRTVSLLVRLGRASEVCHVDVSEQNDLALFQISYFELVSRVLHTCARADLGGGCRGCAPAAF